MNTNSLQQLTNALLYEGYILYPYRADSTKNARERFTFGRVYPQAYSENQNGVEPCMMQTECLLELTTSAAEVEAQVRFLQPLVREIGKLRSPLKEWSKETEPEFEIVPEYRTNGTFYCGWIEAIEREIRSASIGLRRPHLPVESSFEFAAKRWLEPISDEQKEIRALIRRCQYELKGRLELMTTSVDSHVLKITLRLFNLSPVPAREMKISDLVLLRTFASTHVVLQANGAQFLSMTDPPLAYAAAVAACKNIGVWPVLAGDEQRGDRSVMLASPIILYDYPRIAAESPGNLYDGTEIDEILTLRIKAMTNEEKLQMRTVDAHAHALLERTEALAPRDFELLHGQVRKIPPHPYGDEPELSNFIGLAPEKSGKGKLNKGDRVRINPKGRADVMDIALAGKVGIIEGIEQDAEGGFHVALVIEEDPGKDLGMLRQPGHRFFFRPDEVELLKQAI